MEITKMDEDGGSSHLLISKAFIKNRFKARPPERASAGELWPLIKKV
jgi:hypothetical protein